MPITELYSGVRSIAQSEVSLSANNTGGPTAQTTSGIYQALVDVSQMVAGNILQIRVYEKTRTEDTQGILYESILTDAQAEPIVAIPSLILMKGWDFTANALSGTIKTFWSIRQVT